MLNRGTKQKTGFKRTKSKLPAHAKRHMSLPVMGGAKECAHSLSKHEEIHDPVKNQNIVISYALPCTVGHKATTKNPKHKDVYGRVWA